MRIGQLEKLILANLYVCERDEVPPRLATFKYKRHSWWGTPTIWIRNHLFSIEHEAINEITPSMKASFSRALRMLNKKGLIEARNHVSDKIYRTHIKLTVRGQELTEDRNYNLLNVNFQEQYQKLTYRTVEADPDV